MMNKDSPSLDLFSLLRVAYIVQDACLEECPLTDDGCPLHLTGPSFDGLIHCIGNLMVDIRASLMFLRNEQNKMCCSIGAFLSVSSQPYRMMHLVDSA